MKYTKEGATVPSPISSQTVSDKVYLWIKNAIINGDLKPGERIVQETLTEQLQVSRTPVRDALQRLDSEGLVIIRPFHGATVFELSPERIHEIYQIRILLESFAAQKALDFITDETLSELSSLNKQILANNSDIQECTACDRAFHGIICATSKLEYVNSILTGVWDQSNPYRSLYYSVPGMVERTYDEHQQILKGLRTKNAKLLESSIRKHLTDVANVAIHHAFDVSGSAISQAPK